MMPISQELLDELSKEYEKPDELLGDQRILQQVDQSLSGEGFGS